MFDVRRDYESTESRSRISLWVDHPGLILLADLGLRCLEEFPLGVVHIGFEHHFPTGEVFRIQSWSFSPGDISRVKELAAALDTGLGVFILRCIEHWAMSRQNWAKVIEQWALSRFDWANLKDVIEQWALSRVYWAECIEQWALSRYFCSMLNDLCSICFWHYFCKKSSNQHLFHYSSYASIYIHNYKWWSNIIICKGDTIE